MPPSPRVPVLEDLPSLCPGIIFSDTIRFCIDDADDRPGYVQKITADNEEKAVLKGKKKTYLISTAR